MNKFFWIYFLPFFLVSCSKPLAKFTMIAVEKKAPATITFDNQSQKAETYSWNFGDGTSSEETTPVHKYLLSGRYIITLLAKKGNKTNQTQQEIIIDPPHDCLLEMETNKGNLTIKLYDETPQHRDNFIKLAETGYMEGLLFHRVINGFMIQGGDPDSKNAKKGQRLGGGGPGYTIPAEFNDDYVHIKGALAAARTNDAINPKKESSGSQFYIVHGKPISEDQLSMQEIQKGIRYSVSNREKYTTVGGTPVLDNEYTVFGQVIKGIDIIDQIATSQTDPSDRPIEDIKILKIRIIK